MLAWPVPRAWHVLVGFGLGRVCLGGEGDGLLAAERSQLVKRVDWSWRRSLGGWLVVGPGAGRVALVPQSSSGCAGQVEAGSGLARTSVVIGVVVVLVLSLVVGVMVLFKLDAPCAFPGYGLAGFPTPRSTRCLGRVSWWTCIGPACRCRWVVELRAG